MPIKRKNFDSGKFDRSYSVKDHPVAVLLKSNTSLAFKSDEIAKRTGMKKATVRTMLAVLRKKKLVIHKSPYFAWGK